MKKILAMILALALCLSLAACGGKTPPASDSDVNPNPSPSPSAGVPDTDPEPEQTDAEYIADKGKLIIGITIYEPMNYYGDDGELTGFDTEFAQAVCAKLGLTPEFQEINWDTKEIELEAKSIDCIWNGMTITPDRIAGMSISLPYVKNAQVIVVKADSTVASTADLVGKTVVAEMGSAGEAQITGEEADENLAQAKYVGMNKQTDCLMEIKAGTADAAVLDWTLAKSMVGEGTSFADLKMVADLELATEEYGIAFRKGSDFTAKVDDAIKELVADGSLGALADKYDLALAPAIAG